MPRPRFRFHVPDWNTWKERISLALSVLVVFAAMMPRHDVVDGRDVTYYFVLGHHVPRLIFQVVVVICAFPLYSVFYYLLSFFMPDPEEELVEVEKIYKREGGGYIAWKPAVPGTPSGMEYTPPNLTAETTAEEFLAARGPRPMRVMVVGRERFEREESQFKAMKDNWYRIVPQSTLRGLIPVLEKLLTSDAQDEADEALNDVFRAKRRRGVPTFEELKALHERTGHDLLLEYLLEEDEGKSPAPSVKDERL